MHETTRRGLCRLAFWLLCVLPACAIGALGWWVGSDGYRLATQQRLSAHFGLDVTFASVAWSRPDGMRLGTFKLADPETGAVLATAGSLEVVRQEKMLLLSAEGLELHAARLAGLRELVNRQLRLGKPDERIRAVAESLVVILNDRTRMTLESARAQCDFTQAAAQAKVEFRPVDRVYSGVVALRVVRNRQTTPPSVGFEIDATQSPLPCALMAPFVPALARLGADCRFRGSMWGIGTPGGWNAELAGRSQFEEVDLATLVAESFPGQLDGKATLAIDGAKIVGGHIEQAHGELKSGGGTIHRQLAQALAEDLALQATAAGKTFGANHPFSELAFGFAIDSAGLLISGCCETGPKGAVLVDRFGVAVNEPTPAMRLPLTAIERAFRTCRAELIGVLPVRDQVRRR